MTADLAGRGDGQSMPLHEILCRWGRDYLKRWEGRMPWRQVKVLEKILRCRTPELGGQLFVCPDCARHHYRYHSCNDRHCPRCGHNQADQWLERQSHRMLLPAPWFLVTFTVPEPLRQWIRAHPKLGYDILFASSSRALSDLARNPKRLGAAPGMLGVLHTWSRTLMFHPHIHYLMPGGGLSEDGTSWVAAKPNYLLPHKPLADHFRTLLRKALEKHAPDQLAQLPNKTWKQRWVVDLSPMGSGENALRYLSRYVFQTASSNRSVKTVEKGRLRWPFRNRASAQWDHVDLEPSELIRRFLQHVLPAHYTRVRFFGWLHPAGRQRFNRVRALLQLPPVLSRAEQRVWEPVEPVHELERPEPPCCAPPVCPECGQSMSLVGHWLAGHPLPLNNTRAPP